MYFFHRDFLLYHSPCSTEETFLDIFYKILKTCFLLFHHFPPCLCFNICVLVVYHFSYHLVSPFSTLSLFQHMCPRRLPLLLPSCFTIFHLFFVSTHVSSSFTIALIILFHQFPPLFQHTYLSSPLLLPSCFTIFHLCFNIFTSPLISPSCFTDRLERAIHIHKRYEYSESSVH